MQHGRQILHLSASFQKDEQGLDYMPQVQLPTHTLDAFLASSKPASSHFQADYLDVFYVDEGDKTEANSIQLWIKTREKLPDDQQTHNSVLTYISDMGLLLSALVPHGLHQTVKVGGGKMIMASIDHAIWFHRPFRADEWFFYDCRVISTGGGRGLSEGRLYTRDGTLFATTAQQGMLRIPRKS